MLSCDCELGSEAKLWHGRLGHISYARIKAMSENGKVKGMGDLKIDHAVSVKGECGVCGLANVVRKPFKEVDVSHRARYPLERVHVDVADVCGGTGERSMGGHRFYLAIVDDFSRHVDIVALRAKSEVEERLIGYLTFWSRHLNREVKFIRMDNATENLTTEVKGWCQRKGVKLELTVPYSPQQNGVVERMNRSIASIVRALMVQAGLPSKFWGFALRTAQHIINVSPTNANPKGEVPDEKFLGKDVDVSRLRMFGCECWAKRLPEGSKLEPKGRRCVYLGLSRDRKAYALYDIEEDVVLDSRDVVFKENSFPYKKADRLGTAPVLSTDEEQESTFFFFFSSRREDYLLSG